jgi:methylenetetrahydrofolate--tRNA-(uracil-5-)-methyltransferase
VVDVESVDAAVAFRASRWGKETMDGADADAAREEGGAYLNCPMTRDEYEAFLDALTAADQAAAHAFDEVPYFEGCMPVEEARGAGATRCASGRCSRWGSPTRAPGGGRGPWCSSAWRTARGACGTWSASRRGSATPSSSASSA